MSAEKPGCCRRCSVPLSIDNARAHARGRDGSPMFVGACRECERAEAKVRAARPCPYCVGWIEDPTDVLEQAMLPINPDGSLYLGSLAPPHRGCLEDVARHVAEAEERQRLETRCPT